MKLITRVLLLTVLLISLQSWGQSSYSGFMGKKGLIQASVSPFIPVVQTLLDDNYSNENGRLVEKKCLFAMDARLSFSFYKKRNLGFGIEAAKGFFSFAPQQYVYFNGLKHYGKAELIRVNTMQFMPKLELSGSQGLLPVGIAHTIGLGLNFYELKNDNYRFEADDQDLNTKDYLSEHYYNFQNSKFNGFTLLYGINMRLPLTERLLLTYNLNYTVNIVLASGEVNHPVGQYYVSRDDMLESMRGAHALQFIKMGLGLALTL